MKLIIQIPCFNEAESLPVAVNALPRTVTGFDTVEWLIVDDGSSDGTADVAISLGVDHVVKHVSNQGLAKAFMTGIETGLEMGADVIVNTDADNQYDASYIAQLCAPILSGQAEIAIGARPISSIEHFSLVKRLLQKLGSRVVRAVSNTSVEDAPSGFRAFSKSAASRLMVFSSYTYTLETIIQAGQKNIPIASVPVAVNEDLRPFRLVKNIPTYIWRSITTMLRIFVIYRPFKVFSVVGAFLLVAGAIIGGSFLVQYLAGNGEGHVQSLILAAVLLMSGFQACLFAFTADSIAANRRLLEEVRTRQLLNHIASDNAGTQKQD